MWHVSLLNDCRPRSKCAVRSFWVLTQSARWRLPPKICSGGKSRKKKNVSFFVLFADYWYLQSGLEARGGEETASGSRYP